MYIKLTNGTPTTYTIGQLRKDNPNTSFPKKVSNETLAAYDIYPVLQAAMPTADELEVVRQDGFKQDANGNWTQNYVVEDMFKDYTTEEGVVVTKAEQEATYQAEKVAQAEATVRTRRDSLLADTDWMALTDVTMSAEMTTYRQALRDITTHANFPNLEEADWPVKP